MIAWADVVKLAPELASVPADVQTAILGYVEGRLQASAFSSTSDYNLACVFLSAHLATVRERGGAGGAVTSESMGGIARGYAVASTGAALEGTSYGQEYSNLVRHSPARFGWVS